MRVETPELDGTTAVLCLFINASSGKVKKIRDATACDATLQYVVEYVKYGWLEKLLTTQPAARNVWHCRHEAHFTDGLLCRGNRLVTPTACRTDDLANLHVGHTGSHPQGQR